ncbi:MAG TPA: hypothetical protein VFW27_32380 [Actinoplanes sp.]|jgi:predicted SnoaL-like aldol condensation-catalyzing enzyme|nr:hypothetical protein [Actinoplanes sp.]
MTTENKRIVQQALAGLMEPGGVDALAPTVGMQIEIHHLLSDGDHVMVHSRRRLPDHGPEVVVVDILRLDGKLVTDIWEIIEPTAHAAANATWWEPTPAPAQ